MRKRKEAAAKQQQTKETVIVRKRLTNEPALDHTEEQLVFLDDCFGEGSNMEVPVEEAIQALKRDDNRASAPPTSKRNQAHVRKADFKEQILNCLQHKGLASLQLRLQFWLNKLMKAIYRPKQKLSETIER